MKKVILLLIGIVLVLIVLSGCNNNEDFSKKIIGNWRMSDEMFKGYIPNSVENPKIFDWIVTFNEDGTGNTDMFGYPAKPFTYKIDGDKSYYKMIDNPDESGVERISFSGEKLIVTNENGVSICERVSQEYVDSIKYLKDDLDEAKKIIKDMLYQQIHANFKENEAIDLLIKDIKIFSKEEEEEYYGDDSLGKNQVIAQIKYDILNVDKNDLEYLNKYYRGSYDEENNSYIDNAEIWLVSPIIYSYGFSDLTDSFLDEGYSI